MFLFLTLLSISLYSVSLFSPLSSQTKKGKEQSKRTHTHKHTDIHNTHSLAAFSLTYTCTGSEPNPPACLPQIFFHSLPFSKQHLPPFHPPFPQPDLASFSFVYHPSLSPPSLSPSYPSLSLRVKQMGLESRRSLCFHSLPRFLFFISVM